MDHIGSLLFLSSVTENIQKQCVNLVKCGSWLTVTGQLNVTFESGEIIGYVVDEKISKTCRDEMSFSSFSSPLISTDRGMKTEKTDNSEEGKTVGSSLNISYGKATNQNNIDGEIETAASSSSQQHLETTSKKGKHHT